MTIDITIWRLMKKVQTSKEYIIKMVECLVYFIYVCANLDIDGFDSRKFVLGILVTEHRFTLTH